MRSPSRLTARLGRPGLRAGRRGARALLILPGQELQACPEAPHRPEPSVTPSPAPGSDLLSGTRAPLPSPEAPQGQTQLPSGDPRALQGWPGSLDPPRPAWTL